MGRLLEARDDGLNGGPDGLVAVLSHAYWMRRFGGAADAIGRTITVEGVPFTVVGVTPPSLHGFRIGRTFDLVLPLRTEPRVRREFSLVDDGRIEFLRVLMRLEAAIPPEAAGAALRVDQPAIRAVTLSAMRRPEDRDAHLKVPFAVKPAPGGGIEGVRYYGDAARLLFALGCLVLLACCGNISTVLLAHGASRHGELSVRMALGASRWNAAGHLLAESLLLAVTGTVTGLVLSVWVGPLFLAELNDSGLDLGINVGTNWRVWASAGAAGLAAALLCGAGAAWRAARATPAGLPTAGHSKNPDAGRTHLVLVAGQLAFSVVVIVTGALLLRSYQTIASHPALEQLDGVLVTELRFARSTVPPPAREDAANRIRDTLSAMPGTIASLAMNSPFVGGTYMWAVLPSSAPSMSASDRMFTIDAVSADQFRTLGMRLVTGRLLDDRDRPGAPLGGVVNRSFARQFLGSESQCRKNYWSTPAPTSRSRSTVVGVIDDMPYESLLEPIMPAMFLSRAQRIPDSSRAFLILRPPPDAGSRRPTSPRRSMRRNLASRLSSLRWRTPAAVRTGASGCLRRRGVLHGHCGPHCRVGDLRRDELHGHRPPARAGHPARARRTAATGGAGWSSRKRSASRVPARSSAWSGRGGLPAGCRRWWSPPTFTIRSKT